MKTKAVQRPFLWGLSLCMLFAPGMTAFSQTNEELLTRVRREAPRKWKEYLWTMGGYEGTCRDRVEYSDPTRKPREAWGHVVASYPMVLYEWRTDIKSPFRRAEGICDDYYFELVKEGAGKWVVENLRPLAATCPLAEWDFSDPNDREGRSHIVQANPGYLADLELGQPAWKANPGYLIDHTLVAGLHVGGCWAPVVFAHPDFVIDDISLDEKGTQPLIHISFSLSPSDKFDRIPIRKGELTLLPDANWLVSHAVVFLGGYASDNEQFRLVTKHDFNLQGDVPVIVSKRLTSYRITNAGEGEELVYSRSSEYSIQKTADTSPQRFRLSAFGLPEPKFDRGEISNADDYSWER